jgi:DNA-binding GntR family transcriptional regulator
VSENYPLLLHESVSYSSTSEALQLSRVYLRSDYYSLFIFAKPQDGIAA